MNRISCSLAVLLTVSLSRFVSAAFVVNGSMTGPVGFNTQPAPWATLFGPGVHSPPHTVPVGGLADGGGVLAPNIPASPNGGTFLTFTYSVILETDYAGQNISGLVPGATYTLGFYYTNAGATLPPTIPLSLKPGAMTATIAGQTFTTDVMPFEGAGLQTWRLAEFTFQATQPVEHLGFFTHTDLFWGGIDGVYVVPEPGSILLMSAASVGLVFAAASRRKRARLALGPFTSEAAPPPVD